ncbi:MAG: carboxypeptidase-like regulatory domain-containing protein [Desulfuromonadales bacterium]
MISTHSQKCLVGFVVFFLMLTIVSTGFALDTYLLKAKTVDIEGRPMEGSKLFLYDSPNVRRPADFISTNSDRAGQLQIYAPPGKYWVVARYKTDGKYGPLMPGDRHSGEPLEIDMTTGGATADFVVADIRELGQKKRAGATDSQLLKGRVLDVFGAPVAQVYVFANRSKELRELPEFISAWTGNDGRYEIYLPLGATYYVRVSREFPPIKHEETVEPLVYSNGKIDIAMDVDLTVH